MQSNFISCSIVILCCTLKPPGTVLIRGLRIKQFWILDIHWSFDVNITGEVIFPIFWHTFYFYNFVIISPFKRIWSFILTVRNSLLRKMFYTKVVKFSSLVLQNKQKRLIGKIYTWTNRLRDGQRTASDQIHQFRWTKTQLKIPCFDVMQVMFSDELLPCMFCAKT